MKLVEALSSAAIALLSAALSAQQTPPLSLKPLKPNVYWTEGGAGGNAGIVIGKTGVVLIDAKMTSDSAREMAAEIAKLTKQPITHVILTHADVDHAGGLAGLPAGVTVLAHESARDRPPSRTVARTGETMTLDGVVFELHHWAPAHTSGDLVVYLPAEKVAFAGDIVTADRPEPSIQLDKLGSSEGWITSMKGLLGLQADQYVPGHGDVQTKADVQARLTAGAARRDAIAAMVREGKPLDAAPGTFSEVVYRELTGRLK